tara:strand:- start:15360 stop:16079 length:720 start_codon:yes stop_codon:yes gene_type:complete
MNMPIEPPRSPLIDLYYGNSELSSGKETVSREELREIQKEQEIRLLSTFAVQSIFLSLAIMLYETWEFSQFSEPYQAALFYGMLGFSFQSSLYFVWRTMFEDSSNHRKEMKRMKNRQKNKMAQVKFGIQKKQMEMLLESQMAQYTNSMDIAMSDGHIDSNEMAMLKQQLAQIQQTAQQIQPQQQPQQLDLEALAKQLGLDRFRVGPIPLGPKLTVSQPPVKTVSIKQEADKLDLDPTSD